MAGPSELYSLKYNKNFTRQVRHLTEALKIDASALDTVLAGVRWSLQRNPFVWPRVPGTSRLYVAKTSRRPRQLGEVPMLMIVYMIHDTREVELLHVETLDLFL